MQPLAILFGAAFTAAAAFSLGAILLRNSCPDPAVRFVAGAAILSTLIFAVCAVRLAYPATFLGIGAAAILAARSEWRMPYRPKLTSWSLLFLPFVILYFFNAMAPEISYDGSRYHLALVGRELRDHGFRPITDTFYAAFPQGVEMLFLFAYAFGRHSAAALVHFAFLAALGWQVYRRNRIAGVLVFACPIVGVDGSSAYNDVAVAAIVFTLYNVLGSWSDSRSPLLLAAAGLLAGFAFAAKYTAFLAIPFAIAFVLWKARRARPAGAVAALAALVTLPWVFKNYFQFWNPLGPFFNHWFPNPFVFESFEREYRASMATFRQYRWEEIGPVLWLVPLGLASLRYAEGRRLLLAAILFGVPFFANGSARFLIPAIPFVFLALAHTLSRTPRLAVAVAVAYAFLSWPDILKRYARPDVWRLAKVPFREALRIKPESGYLESNLPLYGITRRIEELTPAGSTIFTDTPIPDAYTSRTILVSYQSAANIVSRRVWFSGFVPEHAPVLRARFTFPPRTLGSFRILQTGAGPASWTVHEIRAYCAGRELDRSGWRATPRGLDAALDGRPASLWMSGETLRPGQSVAVDLAAPERADAVVVEIAPDQPDARLVFETGGLRIEPQMDQVPLPDLRRPVAEELKRRGIDYLLAFDGQFGADDLRDRASAWGIRQVTEYKGARLYQLR